MVRPESDSFHFIYGFFLLAVWRVHLPEAHLVVEDEENSSVA